MILSWLPPLLFSLMISNGIDPKWGMTAMAGFVIFAALLLALGTGKWEDILEESGRSEVANSHSIAEVVEGVEQQQLSCHHGEGNGDVCELKQLPKPQNEELLQENSERKELEGTEDDEVRDEII
jgi:hypothetical protein